MKTHTVREVAETLKVHPKTVGAIIDRGELRVVWVGGQRRILDEDLRQYLRVDSVDPRFMPSTIGDD